MAKKNNAVALSGFFSSLFHNFPRLLLTNLLFAVPTAMFFGAFYLINRATGLNSIFIILLTVIPLSPYYAGVTQVTSHMVRGEEKVEVLQNFAGGVKENFFGFLFHGVVLYAALLLCYYSISLYAGLAAQNGAFYIPFALCIIIAVFFLFMFFYIAPMTVTFDMKLRNIYRNSALMTFGELKHNLIAVFGVAVLLLMCATVLMCSSNVLLLFVLTAVLALLIVPSLFSFIVNSAVYGNMYSMITDKSAKSKDIDKKIDDKINSRRGQITQEEQVDFSSIEIDENGDGDEFIFFNGKMIKRSSLIKLKKEAEERKSDK